MLLEVLAWGRGSCLEVGEERVPELLARGIAAELHRGVELGVLRAVVVVVACASGGGASAFHHCIRDAGVMCGEFNLNKNLCVFVLMGV